MERMEQTQQSRIGGRGAESSIRAVGHWYTFVNEIRSRTEQTVHHMLLLERLEREDKGGEEGEAKGGEEGGEWRGGGEGGGWSPSLSQQAP